MKSRTWFSLLLILVFFVTQTDAQMMMGRLLGGGGGFGYFAVGSQSIDIKGLNTRLKVFGYPAFEENYITAGGGGHAVIGNLIIGGEGTALIQTGDQVMGNFRTSFSGGYGAFTLGYIIYSTDAMTLYPQLGLGGGGMNLTIAERSSPSFDEVLSNPRRGVELSSMSFLVDLGVGARYLFSFRERSRGGLTIGVRGGYVHSLNDKRWRLDEVAIPGGPSGAFSGFYLRLTIGGGGKSRTREESDGD